MSERVTHPAATNVDSASVVMLGATGAVGNHVALTLAKRPEVSRLTLLGRRPASNVLGPTVSQETIDVFSQNTYEGFLAGHDVAICTLGVGQPSKISREEFVRTDHDAVLAFAQSCKRAGVRHFELLSSVAADAHSKSFYLQTKGRLEDALTSLQFERLSVFHPSVILTPSNRYGLAQAATLFVTPLMSPMLFGSLRKYRGIKVERLGRAIALNVFQPAKGVETLHWDDFHAISSRG